jgi:hypothetical protein
MVLCASGMCGQGGNDVCCRRMALCAPARSVLWRFSRDHGVMVTGGQDREVRVWTSEQWILLTAFSRSLWGGDWGGGLLGRGHHLHRVGGSDCAEMVDRSWSVSCGCGRGQVMGRAVWWRPTTGRRPGVRRVRRTPTRWGSTVRM